MSRRPRRNTIILDWFNVTYRSVALTVLLVVAVVGGLGGWWYWSTQVRPREAASGEIDRAIVLLAKAERVALADARVDEAKANARAALEEARVRFVGGDWPEARSAAIQSSDRSQWVLDRVEGGSDDARGAQLLRVQGDVRVKLAGEFAWTPGKPRMRLSAGDQVKTGRNGSVELLYLDGTKTTVEPESLLEIREISEDPATKVRRVREMLNWGELTASTQKGNVSGSFHAIATESAVARAESEGEYRIAHDQDTGRTSFSAFAGGPLEIAGGDRKATLGSGERIVAKRGGDLSAKDSLPAVPRQIGPQDQKVFVTDDPGGLEISLHWDPVPGAERYRLTIAGESLFAEPLYDAERAETRVPVDVPPGEYFWRVAAINAAGLQGRFSDTRTFRVTAQRIRDDRDTEPPDLEITEAVLTGNMLILSGRTEPGATLWIDNEKQDIDESGSFYTVVKMRREGWNEVVVVAQDAAGNERKVRHRQYVETY